MLSWVVVQFALKLYHYPELTALASNTLSFGQR
jgi:hypothetical protein